MASFVSADWVEARLGSPGFVPLDPRGPMRYLQGHLRGAVNLPIRNLFGPQGRLRTAQELADLLGSVGLGDQEAPVLYDSPDGRNAALLAWVLEYLGRTDVRIMDVFFEHWSAQGRQVFYRPVKAQAREFRPRVNPAVRASLEDVSAARGLKLVDLRGREEYTGKAGIDERPGHIPGAINLVWQELAGEEGQVLRPPEQLQRIVDAAGIDRHEPVIAYCRTGVRAAVGYLALQQLDYDVRLYDGSYAEWSQRGMPVEAPSTGGEPS